MVNAVSSLQCAQFLVVLIMTLEGMYEYAQVGKIPGVIGLTNLGNTCYANSVIQSLFSDEELKNLLVNYQSLPWNEDVRFKRITTELSKLFRRMVIAESSVQCAEFLETFRDSWPLFRIGVEQDAEEFLSLLVDCLHESLKENRTSQTAPDTVAVGLLSQIQAAWEGRTKSLISNLFYTQEVSVITCSNTNCDYTRVSCDQMSSHLTLTVRNSKCTLMEILRDSYGAATPAAQSKCNTCEVGELSSQTRLGRLPSLLVLHLSRFRHSDGVSSKNEAMVDFPHKLNMKEFTEAATLQSSTEYELIAVINHTGYLAGGHYVALCKRGDRWVECNDARVGGISTRKMSGVAAYILLYKRVRGALLHLPFDADLTPPIIAPVSVRFQQQIGLNEEGDSPKQCHSPTPLELVNKAYNASQPSKIASKHCRKVSQVSNDASEPKKARRRKTPSSQNTSKRSVHEVVVDAASEQPINSEAATDTTSEPMDDCPTTHDMPLMDRVQSTESSRAGLNIVVDVVLTEDDVPGAALDLNKINTYNVPQLRRWLKCRGLNQTGSADTLRDRILKHVRMGKGSKIDPKIDSGMWYNKKRALLLVNLDHANRRIPLFPAGPNVWREFPGFDIPQHFNRKKVDTYVKTLPAWKFSYTRGAEIVQSCTEPVENSGYYTDDEHICPSDEDTDNDGSFTRLVSKGISKCLDRGRKFLRSGRILRVWDTEKGGFYFLKAQVQASMQQQVYVVTSIINQETGNVLDATCTCKANALKRCAHIAGVLILVVDHVEAHGYDAVTCTGKPCYWVRRPEAKNPGIVAEKGHYYAGMQMERRSTHDPRPTKYQIPQPDEKALYLRNNLSVQTPPRCWTLHLKHAHREDALDPDAIESVAVHCSKVLWELNRCRLDHDGPFEIPGTKGQAKSSVWIEKRKFMCTASTSKQMLGLTSLESKKKFLRKNLWGLDRFVSPAMEYGTKHEPVAREAYKSWLIQEDPTALVEERGLMVNPKWPQFACSPDGTVVSEIYGHILLEIKWLSSPDSRNVDPVKFDSVFSKKKKQSFYLYRDDDGEIALKRSHAYYFQIQMSLAILEFEMCHLFVWSEGGHVTVFVSFDAAFWHERSLRLMTTHRQLLVPELVMKRTPKHLEPLEMTYPEFHESVEDMFFS